MYICWIWDERFRKITEWLLLPIDIKWDAAWSPEKEDQHYPYCRSKFSSVVYIDREINPSKVLTKINSTRSVVVNSQTLWSVRTECSLRNCRSQVAVWFIHSHFRGTALRKTLPLKTVYFWANLAKESDPI